MENRESEKLKIYLLGGLNSDIRRERRTERGSRGGFGSGSRVMIRREHLGKRFVRLWRTKG